MVESGVPVPRIRELRKDRGWTQKDVADQLARLAWIRKEQHVGVTGDMVAKWERGEKRPVRMYRDLLCILFGSSPDELGIGHGVPADAEPSHPSASTMDSSVLEVMDGATAVLERLGEVGSILRPKVFETWKDDLMHRRALLKLMGLAPAAAALQVPPAGRPSRAGKPTPETVADLEQLADKYQAMYHTTAPAALMTPVIAHLDTIADLLRQGPGPDERRRLQANRARVGTLAGRLAFFDLQDPMTARGYYNVALESAREAGDHLQAAAALGHVAFIPAAEHGLSASLDYLRGAAHHVSKRPHGPLDSWLAAVESEIQTNAGTPAAALAAIDRARDALALPGPALRLPWFDYYDATRLAGFAGYATLRAGRLNEARTTLTDAITKLPRTAVKQRAVFLADLATLELHGGDLDHACRLAGDAAAQLHRAGYATGSGRLREFRTAVDQWKTSVPVRTLDEQLATLGS
jgi:transcriptional regulator with XRE-family HTH domain